MTQRLAALDCYGTLIDWNRGLRDALGSDELLARYHEVEPVVQGESPGLSYREVMLEVARRVGARDPDALPRSLPGWQPFPEVRDALEEAQARGWRLAILSNTDREFIQASMERIGVPFEHAIVASEIGSYKPALGHWRELARVAGRLPGAHVGASLFHDIAPAKHLGLSTVWVNRLGEVPGPEPTCEIADLSLLPDVLDQL